MAVVEIAGVTKTYGDVRALADIELTIGSGEFFTLLGPSGCGKTTLLRTIAGFHKQDAGTIRVDNAPLDDVPAYKRDIGMVFQDYAIFPHKSVAGNVAFGLENRRVRKAEIKSRVEEALSLVHLDGLSDRMPHQLSGGQQQRVGLARAMVINPKILLMDEPLSNLDAKLRIELREDIRDLQRRLGTTTVYVTHDQEEALVVSDRICVMNQGRVHQVASPFDIYRNPATPFVAGFVGAMNVVDDGLIAFRPEDVLTSDPGQSRRFAGLVEKISFAGREAVWFVSSGDGTIQALLPRPSHAQLDAVGQEVQLFVPEDRLIRFAEAA